MRESRFIAFVLLFTLLLIFIYIQKQRVANEYMQKKEALIAFEKEAQELGTLKLKYKDKRLSSRALESLKRIESPSKDYVKSNLQVLEFDGLDLEKLNRVIKKIQNSTLKLNKLEIIRVDDTTSKIKMEIKR